MYGHISMAGQRKDLQESVGQYQEPIRKDLMVYYIICLTLCARCFLERDDKTKDPPVAPPRKWSDSLGGRYGAPHEDTFYFDAAGDQSWGTPSDTVDDTEDLR